MLTANSPSLHFCRLANKEGPSQSSNAPSFGKCQRHFPEVSYFNNFMKNEYDVSIDDRDEYHHHFDTSSLEHFDSSRFPNSNMDSNQDNMPFDLPLCLPSEYLGHDDIIIKSCEDQSFENCIGSSSQSVNYNEFNNASCNYFNRSKMDLFENGIIKINSSEFPAQFTENDTLRLDVSTPASVASAIHVAKPVDFVSRGYLRGQEVQIKDGSFGGRAGQPAKRRQVKNACVHCQKACKKCDESRPCHRCVKYGFVDSCRDSVRKERKKGVKRGPYKRRIRDRNGLLVPTPKSSIASLSSLSVLATPRTKASSLRKQTRQMKMYNRSKVIFPQEEQLAEDDLEQKPEDLISFSSCKETGLDPLPPSTYRQQKLSGSQQIFPLPAKTSFPINHLSAANGYMEIPPYSSARAMSTTPAIDNPLATLHSINPTTSTAHHYVAAAAAVAAAANAPEPYRAAAAQYASAMSSPAPHVYQRSGLPSMVSTTSNQLAVTPATSMTSPKPISDSKNRWEPWDEEDLAQLKVGDCLLEHSSLQQILSQPRLPFFSNSPCELVTSSFATSNLM